MVIVNRGMADMDVMVLRPALRRWQTTDGCVIEINDTGTKLRYSFPQPPRRRAELSLVGTDVRPSI